MDIDKERAAGKPDFSKFATLEEYNEAMVDWQRGQDTAPPAAVPAPQVGTIGHTNTPSQAIADACAGIAVVQHLAERAAAPAQAVDALNLIVRDIAELDYSSDTVLDRMEVSEADLRLIISRHVAALAAQPAAQVDDERVAKLRSLVAIQCSPGNFDVDEYMRGMANGLLVALSVFTDEEPKFKEPPAPVANAGQAQAVAAGGSTSLCDLRDAFSEASDYLTISPDQAAAMHQAMTTPPEAAQPVGWVFGNSYWEAGNPRVTEEIKRLGKPRYAAAPLPQQVAQTEAGIPASRPTSRDAYLNMTPERRAAFDADMTKLDQRIAEHRRSRDRRTHDEPVAEERRHGDRRHAERRDAED